MAIVTSPIWVFVSTNVRIAIDSSQFLGCVWFNRMFFHLFHRRSITRKVESSKTDENMFAFAFVENAMYILATLTGDSPACTLVKCDNLFVSKRWHCRKKPYLCLCAMPQSYTTQGCTAVGVSIHSKHTHDQCSWALVLLTFYTMLAIPNSKSIRHIHSIHTHNKFASTAIVFVTIFSDK